MTDLRILLGPIFSSQKGMKPERVKGVEPTEMRAADLVDHLIQCVQFLNLDNEHAGYYVSRYFQERSHTDFELFQAVQILQQKYNEEVQKNPASELSTLYMKLIRGILFTLGQSESKSYEEVGRTPEQIFLLPSDENIFFHGHDGMKDIEKIEPMGIQYPGGSSQYWGSEGPRESPPLTWDHLVCVRRTGHPGSMSNHSLTVERSDRMLTQHWTLNAPVRAHSGSSWAERGITIFAPASATVEQNGPPLSINNVNTIWYGRDIILPHQSVILVEESLRHALPRGYEDTVQSVISFRFTSTHDRLMLERLIIHRMGYSFFPGSMWYDSRVDTLLDSLKKHYGIVGAIELDREYDRKFLDGLLQIQLRRK